MTDAEGDIIRYWRRKCDICKDEHPVSYEKCNENSYHCIEDSIDVYR